jgi:hypothetical protein
MKTGVRAAGNPSRVAVWKELHAKGQAGKVADEIVRHRDVPPRLLARLNSSRYPAWKYEMVVGRGNAPRAPFGG